MATITGIFEGLIVVKEGQGKRGPWKLYSIKVDCKKYGIGFNPVKAATGERVVFETQTNDNGYEDADPKTFKVIGPATAESSAAASGATPDARQGSIERQTCLKAAAEVVAAQITAGVLNGQPNAAVSALVSDFMRILHPAPKPAPPPKRVEPEDENQDEFGDSIPY
jgi:hypothetical protein